MKIFFTFSFVLLFTEVLSAQTAIDSYNIYNNPAPATTNNSALGWINASSPYSNSTTYDLYYGKLDAVLNGTTREILDFGISSGPAMGSYIPVPYSGTQPFDTVIVKRIDNTYTTGRRVNSLFELGSFDGGSSSLYLQPQYNETMEDLINRKYLNVGSDNTFVNDNSSTTNNIERLDLIFSSGISASTADLAKVGILINERGGNDYFRIAAITSIDANKNVTGLGTLVNITPSTWGTVGPAINTVVMSKEEADPFLRPKEDIGTQTISGVFISLLNLGITTGGTYIRGVSLFPNDVDGSMDLIDLTNVPTNTAGGSIGGLDLMAGGGFFREIGTLVILPVHFLNISGQAINNQKTKLNWEVFNNNSAAGNFIIERSGNGIAWLAIGQTAAAAQNGTQQYTFIDQVPLPGKNYYRVKNVDFDGKITFCEIILINHDNKNNRLKIFYTPGQDHAWISTGKYEGLFTMRTIDFNGKLLKEENAVYGNSSIVQYNLSGISSRAYILQVIHDGRLIRNQKIIR